MALAGSGNDTFLNGEVQIQGFVAGEDKIDLHAVSGLTFDWLMAHSSTVDGNLVLDLGNGQHMTLVDTAAGSLHANDFVLGG